MRFPNPADDPVSSHSIMNRRPLPGTFFSALITAFFGVLVLLLAYESWALFTDHTTISDYVRPAVRAFPGWALAGAVVIGIGLGHFLWGPASGPASPGGDLMLRGSRR
jgi:hypothetical protein